MHSADEQAAPPPFPPPQAGEGQGGGDQCKVSKPATARVGEPRRRALSSREAAGADIGPQQRELDPVELGPTAADTFELAGRRFELVDCGGEISPLESGKSARYRRNKYPTENEPKITNLVVAPAKQPVRYLLPLFHMSPRPPGPRFARPEDRLRPGPIVQPHRTKGPSVGPCNCLKTAQRRKHGSRPSPRIKVRGLKTHGMTVSLSNRVQAAMEIVGQALSPASARAIVEAGRVVSLPEPAR
jgi:hypothetical protein